MQPAMIVSEPQSKFIFRLAGVTAILIVLAGLTDAATSMGTSLLDNRMIPVAEWFTLFQTSRFEALSRLGVINIVTLSCCIPVYLAFNQVFRKEQPVIAALAPLFFFTGIAIYLSSNSVFALFALSQKYAAATAAQKPLLEAAGQALLAQGADLTPGTFVGLFFTQIAGLLITGAMLRGSVFGRWTGRFGLVGYSLMTVFFILTAFFPAYFGVAMGVSAAGALLMLTYQILIARKFFQLAK